MKIKFCPKCGYSEIILFIGGKFGTIYKCKKCGYRGVLFPERNINPNKNPNNKKTRLNKQNINAIILDIGGVLELNKSPQILNKNKQIRTKGVHEYITKKLGITLDQYFDSIDSTYADAIEGKISRKKTIKTIAKNLKISEKKLKKLYKKAYSKNFKTNKELYKIALKLKKIGYKIAILSDQWYLSRDVFVKEKYAKKFDVVVISCDSAVSIRKPYLKIYKILLKKLKIPAKQCLFIDNQTWNLKPAKKLGIKTILFKNNKQLIRDLKKFGIKINKK